MIVQRWKGAGDSCVDPFAPSLPAGGPEADPEMRTHLAGIAPEGFLHRNVRRAAKRRRSGTFH